MDYICKQYCYFYKKEKTLPISEKCGSFQFFYNNSFLLNNLNPEKKVIPEVNNIIIEKFCKNHCNYFIRDCDWTDPEIKEKISPCGGFFFIHDLLNRYAVLNDNFFIKRLENDYLFDRKNDELYEIDENALEFFSKCNGKYKLYKIVKDFESIVYLLENKIIFLSDKKIDKPVKISLNKAPFPSLRYLEIQLTGRCNLNCMHCYLGNQFDIDIDFELLKNILDEFEHIQGLRVIFSGGEPFLYKKIESLISLLKDYSFRRIFLTNGTVIRKELLENIDEIQISIDGLEDSHDFIRGKGTFRKILKNIEIIQDKGIDLSIATMIHRKNLNEFDDIEKFIKAIGVKEWGIDVPVITGNFINNRFLSVKPEEAKYPLGKKFGGSFHEPLSGFACGVHLSTVFPDGKIAKCGFYYDRAYGDLKKESLKNALKKRNFIKLKELECSKIKCKYIDECRGGCRYRAGDSLEKDIYMCECYIKTEG